MTAGENNAAGIQRLVGLRLLTELSLSVVHVALVPQTSEERDWPAAVKCTKHCSSLGKTHHSKNTQVFLGYLIFSTVN